MLTPLTLRNLWAYLIIAMLSACGGSVARVDLTQPNPATAPGPIEPTILVVTLTGKLGTTELARCHRSIREAEANGCNVIFRIDEAGSQGESLSDLQSLLDVIQTTTVGTTAVLRGRVTQGAAALALCTSSTYMLKGAHWGEITQPEKEFEAYLTQDPEAHRQAQFDQLRSVLQSRLERRKNKLRPDAMKMALAMADPRVQLVSATVREGGIERSRIITRDEMISLQTAGATILGETLMTRPLMLSAAQAEEFALSSGTLSGYDQLYEILNIDRTRVGELTVNWAENMVAWLEMLAPFLLVMGFLMLLVEVKTPGTGLPGLLGVAFLGLAMFHSYLVGLAEVTEIIVFFLGLIAIAVEIFVLPGTVIFGVVGFLCLMLALVLSRQSFFLPSNSVEEDILLANLANLTFLFIMVMVLGAVMWRILPKVPVFNRLFLKPPGSGDEPTSNNVPSGLGLTREKLEALVGRSGEAATVLRPAGVMEIDMDRIDVVTEGEFVPLGAELRVLYVQGNRVVVGAVEKPGEDDRESERGSVGVVVLLCILGIALIFAEVIFPSFGIIGICAAVSLLSAIFVAFQESIGFGVGVAVFEAIAAPIAIFFAFKLLPNTPIGRRLILSGPATDGTAAAGDGGLGSFVGKDGVTVSPLRPAGFARIDGRKVDVVTRGEMLPDDCKVVVIDVTGNRVVVAEARDGQATSQAPTSQAPESPTPAP